MGTSGAYGGSGSQSWGDAHDGLADLPATGPTSDAQVGGVVEQIAAAIQRQFSSLRSPSTTDFNPSALLGRRTASDGSVTSGRSRSTGGGMSSSSSARGAAAIWAGHAFNSGNQDDLDQLGVGLRLEDMREMSESGRCSYILDAILGAPGSLDEEVLRRASLDALKELMRNPGQSVDESVSAFMSAYVYQTALVELTSQKASHKLTADQVLRHEKTLKQYIKGHVKYSGITDGPRISGRTFLKKVAEFCDRALNFLKKVTA